MMTQEPVSDLLGIVRTAWQRASTVLEKDMALTPRPPPAAVTLIDNVDNEIPFGGVVHEGALLIADSVAGDTALLFGVVAKECMRSTQPEKFLCPECLDDVSMEFARQLLSGSDRKKWVEFWSKHAAEKRVDGVLLYSPVNSFLALHELAGSDGLKEIVRDLANVSRYGIELGFDEYVRYFEARFKRFSVSLTAAEVKILDALHRNPETTNESIAQKAGLTPQWVSQKIASLRSRGILRSWDAVHFSKIGIRMYNLLMSCDEPDEDPYRFFVTCPFVYAIRRVLTGPWHVLVILSVPDSMESVRALDRCLKSIGKWNIRTSLAEIVSSGSSFCFDYYEPERAGWRIPWDLERVQLAKIFSDNLASAFPRPDIPKPKTRLILDTLDMRVIDAVRRGKSSVSSVREELKAGQGRVASSLRKLKEDGVISTVWETHNVGLVEHLFVSTDDEGMARAVAAWSQRLPRCISSFDLDGHLVLLASLPLGGSCGLTSCLEMLPRRVYIGLLGAPMYSRWEFPLGLWDAHNQRWKCPEQPVADWLDSIR